MKKSTKAMPKKATATKKIKKSVKKSATKKKC